MTEDAALFGAIAEYDRLATVEQALKGRADVFRPGIPEADEANKAYEAAYDEAMAVWEKARKIPATTQAGLFAKLQATIRFMADLEQDELYDAEWSAIKADVQRIAGGGTAMTEKLWSADGAKLDEVRGHVFDMEDHLTCAQEGVQALMGFVDMTDAHAYGAAVNVIADVLNKEMSGIREHFRLAWKAAKNGDKPPPKAVEDGGPRP